jgi:hypothetical protein
MHGLGVDLIGYTASAFIAAAMLMVSIIRLRIINLIGSATFIVYGFFLDSMPLIVTNGFIACVILYRLRGELSDLRASRDLLVPARPDELEPYAAAHLRAIGKTSPLYAARPAFFDALALGAGGQTLAALRRSQVRGLAVWLPAAALDKADLPRLDGAPALISAAKTLAAGAPAVFVVADYHESNARRAGLGRTFHELLDKLQAQGYRQVFALGDDRSKRQRKYLEHMGYKRVGGEAALSLYRRSLPN